MIETTDEPEHPDREDEPEDVDGTPETEHADTLTFDEADPEFRRKSDKIAKRYRKALNRLA